MEEELLAQPQVMKLLDSLREQYTRYQEICRQRNKRTQLDEIHAKVMQVQCQILTFTSDLKVQTDMSNGVMETCTKDRVP